MKKIYTVVAGLILTISLFAQAPEKISYQAVVRNASNNLVTSQPIGMQISILQTTTTGTVVYIETHNVNSNANGLVTLEIGTGTIVSGDFTTIDWTNNTYFIKTETDPTGGTSYSITGTSQLMSVPYALHAKTAERITGTINYTETDPVFGASVANGITAIDTANWNNHTINTNTQLDETAVDNFVANNGYLTYFIEVDSSVTNEIQTLSRTGTTVTLTKGGGAFTDSINTYTAGAGIVIANKVISTSTGSSHYIGELFGGGIVYYVYDNGAHGLVASLDDLDGGSGVAWSGNTNTLIGTSAQSFYDGASNTSAMVGQNSTANKAGTLCNSYSNGGFSDWYLPANWELNLLYNSAYVISDKLANDGNGATQPLHPNFVTPTYGRYWSSTESNTTDAWIYIFNRGYSIGGSKTSTYRVRAIRAF